MKKIFLGLTLICATVLSANAQAIAQPAAAKTANAAAPVLTFKEAGNTHDFGAIPQGTPVSYNFTFTNTGKAPLVLTSATASCGCTVPEWPKAPVEPGKSGIIRVFFNSQGKFGIQNKTVTILANTKAGRETIVFTANVIGTPLK